MRRDATTVVVLVRGRAELASWVLTPQGRLDLSVVDHLARLQLAARRLGCSIRLRPAEAGLPELLELCGLDEVVPAAPLLQVGGQAEGGEQAGVEEVVVADDPVA